MGIREDSSGAIKKTVCSGPLIRLIQKAAKKPTTPFAIALVNAEPADIEGAFGPLFPLLDPQNRGTGPYAPSIHLPDLGPIAIPPNVHVMISLRAGVELSSDDAERYGRSFRLTDASDLMCDVQGSESVQDLAKSATNTEDLLRPRGH